MAAQNSQPWFFAHSRMKMFSWFLTRNGRVFTHFSLGIAAASVFATPLIVHGPLLETYKSIFEAKRFGKQPGVNPDVLARAKNVVNECHLTEIEKQKIEFFNVIGRDICHAGGNNSPWGTVIGLPFMFDKTQNLGELKIVGMESVDLMIESPELLDTFELSEEAEKFAIAKEIYSANINRIIENAFIASFCLVCFPAQAIRRINAAYKTFKLPLKARLLMYSVFYGMSFCIYKCLKDPFAHVHEKKCIEKAANLGPSYVAGGIQFYENMLQQNKELRQLLKKQGESLYTKDGDLNYFIFAPKFPITKKLEFLKKLQNEKSKP